MRNSTRDSILSTTRRSNVSLHEEISPTPCNT